MKRAATHSKKYRSATAGSVLVAACMLAQVIAQSGCGNGEQRPAQSQTAPRAVRPALRLVAITDLGGYLEPCGCQSRPLGGIDKAAGMLRQIGSDGVATVMVSAGDLLFGDAIGHEAAVGAAAEGAARQAQWQAETLAEGLGRLGLAAATPGPHDRLQSSAILQSLAARGRFTLFASGATPAGKPEAAALQDAGTIVARDGIRVGVWGLSVTTAAEAQPDPIAEAKRLTTALRGQGADLVVGLLSADARSARRLAGAVEGLDFLLLGGVASAAVPPPERIGQTTLLRAGEHGHGLLVVDLFRGGKGPFADVSAWTRKAEKDAADQRVSELAERVKRWKADSATDRALLAEQEARLTELRAQAAALSATPAPSGNAFSARFVELGPEVKADPDMQTLLDAHDRRVNEENKVALAGIAPAPVPEGSPGYVGSTRCGDCHEEALAWWQKHEHGVAYATLEKLNKQFSLSCVSCHVTGYGKPGGAAVVQNAGLTNVGCESCHGPGSFHVEDQDADDDKNVRREVAEPVCIACHNEEHSDQFAYAKYKAKLIVPGHGLPPAEPKP